MVAGKAVAASTLTFEVEGIDLFAVGFGVVDAPQVTLGEDVPHPLQVMV